MIDLRSDTITKPTDAMRQAMASAEVGDDVLGDDPTVRTLERRTAELLGKDAAVFMPSGTMTNQVAIRCHTEGGDEILIADNAHVFFYEAGAPGGVSGVLCRMLPTRRGVFAADDLRAAIRPANVHFAPQKLVCIENTSNRGGGSCWPIETVAEVAQAARDDGLRMHLDGARLWNAAVATGVPERAYAQHFDSVSVCFSKGLGAPVGSCLVGDAAFCRRARRFRKMLGGGMRQSGVLAAAALHALEHHRDRLADDHANARRLAEGLAELPGLRLDPPEIDTNILILRVAAIPAAELVERLRSAGVLCLATGAEQIRLVTSLAVDATDVDAAVTAFAEVLAR